MRCTSPFQVVHFFSLLSYQKDLRWYDLMECSIAELCSDRARNHLSPASTTTTPKSQDSGIISGLDVWPFPGHDHIAYHVVPGVTFVSPKWPPGAILARCGSTSDWTPANVFMPGIANEGAT
jgi:hypothetical protein